MTGKGIMGTHVVTIDPTSEPWTPFTVTELVRFCEAVVGKQEDSWEPVVVSVMDELERKVTRDREASKQG